MPRDGSGNYSRTTGVYSGSTSWGQTRDASRKIRADDHDTHDQDIASALSSSLAKDGQTTPTANLPMGGFLHTNVADATARTQYAKVSQIQDSAYLYAGTTGGTTSAYTATLSPALTAYATGMQIGVKFNAACAATPTLNVNAVAAATIKHLNGNALRANDIAANSFATLMYDGSAWLLLTSAPVIGSWASPALTANTGTISVSSVDYAKYVYNPITKMVEVLLKATYTVTSGTPTQIIATLPITATGTNGGVFTGEHDIGGGVLRSLMGILTSASTVAMFSQDSGSLVGTGSHFIYARGYYEAA